MSTPTGEQETYNRCFVLGGKGSTKEDFQNTFSKYGEVKDVWIVTDRKTGDDKGVCYITFAKASEAALAIEEINGRLMGNNPKPLKVLLANSRREGNVRDPKEEEKMLRLFIIVPKTFSEDDIKKKFEEFGDIEYVRILKDRKTEQSRGLAYVKYYRAYHAALALESCDPSFKAVFAATKAQLDSRRGNMDQMYDNYSDYGVPSRSRTGQEDPYRTDTYDRYSAHRSSSSSRSTRRESTGHRGPEDVIRGYRHESESRLEVMAAHTITYEQLYRLFDIVPGLEYCDMDSSSAGIAMIKYSSPQSAAYAKDKLGDLEYPPGFRIAIRYPQSASATTAYSSGDASFDSQRSLGSLASDLTSSLQTAMGGVGGTEIHGELQTLVQSIQKATNLLQSAGIATGATEQAPVGETSSNGGGNQVLYCNAALPALKNLADHDASCVQRLFIVSQPGNFPEHILRDCFCRFGDMIDAYFMPNKNYGYVKFASKESGQQAISTLHGQLVCGRRLKVMEAEPPKYSEDSDGAHATKRAKSS